jgi:pilus assembly protein Flp/PilA
MFRHLRKLIESDDGATAVEYAVMLALIVVACLGSVYTLSTATADSFDESAAELSSVLGS